MQNISFSTPNRLKIIHFLICISFLTISFRNEIASICFYLAGFFSVIEIVNKKINVFKLKNNIIIFFVLWFIIELIGMLYTKNLYFGLKDLESKLLFIIVPLIMIVNSFYKFNLVKSFRFYVVGILINFIYLLYNGYLTYNETKIFPRYIDFSNLMHPTYLSIYYTFAIAILLEFKKKIINNFFLIYFISLSISFGIIILDSKAGLISITVVLLFYFIKFIFKLKLWKKIITILSIIFVLIISIKQFSNSRFSEIFQNLKTSTQFDNYNGIYNSTELRIIIWRASKQVIFDNLIIGTGTGDIKDELINQYKKNNFVDGVNMSYNCHSQVLQVLATFGFVFGGLIIIFFTKIFYDTFKVKKYFFCLIILIFSINFLFESLLEVKAGVEIFVLFFLALSMEKEMFEMELNNF
jgi:O-antigen ligase